MSRFFSKFKSAFNKLIFLPNGEFSLTRIFMFVTFTTAIILVPLGILLDAVWGFEIPQNIYDYTFKLSGGGIVQYGLTKVVGEFAQRRPGSTDCTTEDTSTPPANATQDV